MLQQGLRWTDPARGHVQEEAKESLTSLLLIISAPHLSVHHGVVNNCEHQQHYAPTVIELIPILGQ